MEQERMDSIIRQNRRDKEIAAKFDEINNKLDEVLVKLSALDADKPKSRTRKAE